MASVEESDSCAGRGDGEDKDVIEKSMSCYCELAVCCTE